MNQYHEVYPEYNFQQHKGYPTFAHRTILTSAGPSPIHRLTYAPVKAVISVKNRYDIHIPCDLFDKEKTGKKGTSSGKKEGKKRSLQEEVVVEEREESRDRGIQKKSSSKKKKTK
jgi:hypothetical protein